MVDSLGEPMNVAFVSVGRLGHRRGHHDSCPQLHGSTAPQRSRAHRRDERQRRGLLTMAATSLRCSGCGALAPPLREQPYPFRCGRATDGDGVDHVMERILDGRGLSFPAGGEASPFARYRTLFHVYHTALAGGLGDAEYLALVDRLDARLASACGRGFRVTPLACSEALSRALGFAPGGGVWVKDETGGVGDSHKARHLMGILLYLEVIERLARPRLAPLAIASCGNAALAAAVVAHAQGRALRAYVPPDADSHVLARLAELGAEGIVCPRTPGLVGDPCVRAFRRAVAQGALPFACQGREIGLAIDGGATLGAELADEGPPFDRVLVQVGGGALAAAIMQGFADALALGRISALPRFHAVQSGAVSPLPRAWERVTARVLGRLGADPAAPFAVRASRICAADPALIAEALRHAAAHRADFMWPWEGEPRSLARAIIDDETYDWLAVVRGMLITGGYPITVSEPTLARANALAREATGITVGPSGSAGLAGLIELLAAEPAVAAGRVAVIFSGVRG
ncbi:PLP-dependent lyase/thiolase [Sorangium sp. So ce385]|uniref:PLP-dependent lyase/thiolase n=1 Tax=Sorangium sp. So ce385 TaxID=3133308 RepID=UPI003F5AFCEA